jgi:hypothetical protein
VYAEALARKLDAENEVKAAIGDCDGLEDPALGKVTYRYVKPQEGPDWKAVAEHLWEELDGAIQHEYGTSATPLKEIAELHQRVIREGFRRISAPKLWRTDNSEDA